MQRLTPTQERTLADWQTQAASLKMTGQAFINGRYVDAVQGQKFSCHSAIDGRLLVQVARCQKADVNLAVTAARQSFADGRWRFLSPEERKQRLLAFARLVETHQEELALLETLDMGKPIRHALHVDLAESIETLAWTAEAVDKYYAELAPAPRHQLGLISREALGVVALIVPWNFPLLMACTKLAPALAMGNSVILKPSEKSPLSALRIAALASEAGIPDGVFNVLPGYGAEAGEALARHPDVDCIAFTGSTQIARHLLVCAGQSNMKRVWLEAGGKSPNIVFADAPDLDKTARGIAQAIAFNMGQVCSAGSRLLVEASIHDLFVEKVAEALNFWLPGHPLDPASRNGAIVDQQQWQRIHGYLQTAQQEGAKLYQGGKLVNCVPGGHYLQPALLTQVRADSRVAQEEVFGPVLAVMPFADEAEAIALANRTDYGLAAGIWTENLGRAHRVARDVQAGSIWINEYDTGGMTAAFGGFRQSGNARDKSLHAFEQYSDLKSTWIKLESGSSWMLKCSANAI